MANYSENEIIEFLKKRIAQEQGLPIHEIDINTEFINLGLDSIKAIFILQDLEKLLGIELNPILMWDYPTIASFSKYIATNFNLPKN